MSRKLARHRNAREIAPGVWWLPQCLARIISGTAIHIPNTPYLVVGADKVLIYDTGLPESWDDLEPSLEEILGGRTIDFIVASHSEVPHCGNTPRLLAKYPDSQLVGDVRDFHLYFPRFADRMVQMKPR